VLDPADPLPAPDPDPCADGSEGVETAGARTGGLGTGTGGGVGVGTEAAGTVGVGRDGVGTVGAGSVGVVTVGVGTVGVDTVGIETEVVDVGSVSAGLGCGSMPTRSTATAAARMASAALQASRDRRLNRLRSRTRWPLQPPRMAPYRYPLLMEFIRTQADSTPATRAP
jgi:hypothetical protein